MAHRLQRMFRALRSGRGLYARVIRELYRKHLDKERRLGHPIVADPGFTVDHGSEFGAAIRDIIHKTKPRRIVETGTYVGRGTTAIIHGALTESGVADFYFLTIEVNPSYYTMASEYFATNGMKVIPLLGLSVPRGWLPSLEELREHFDASELRRDIHYDYDEARRAEAYFSETDHAVPDRMLSMAMGQFHFRPDLVLLDSAGHLGNIEFQYFLRLIRGSCLLALDDTRHCKHCETMDHVRKDERFTVLADSGEGHGFCICRYRHKATDVSA